MGEELTDYWQLGVACPCNSLHPRDHLREAVTNYRGRQLSDKLPPSTESMGLSGPELHLTPNVLYSENVDKFPVMGAKHGLPLPWFASVKSHPGLP